MAITPPDYDLDGLLDRLDFKLLRISHRSTTFGRIVTIDYKGTVGGAVYNNRVVKEDPIIDLFKLCFQTSRNFTLFVNTSSEDDWTRDFSNLTIW